MSFDERRNYDLFLEVPFSEKEKAKEAGAWWSPQRRKWFVPARRSVVPFVRWLPPDERVAYEEEMARRTKQEQHFARLRELETLAPRWTDPHEILRQLGRKPVFNKYGFCAGCDSHFPGWYIGDMELRHYANTDYGTFHKSELAILEAALDAGLV